MARGAPGSFTNLLLRRRKVYFSDGRMLQLLCFSAIRVWTDTNVKEEVKKVHICFDFYVDAIDVLHNAHL